MQLLKQEAGTLNIDCHLKGYLLYKTAYFSYFNYIHNLSLKFAGL